MGTEHTILMYYGKDSREHWTPSLLQYALTHTYSTGDKAGITEWLFSSFLYLELNHGKYKFGLNVSQGTTPARKEDWEWYMNRLFSTTLINDEPEGLDALELSIEYWKAQIGNPPRRHKVILMMPSPFYNDNYEGWGTIEEDGAQLSLDMQVLLDRIKAATWYVDEIINRFNQKNYKNIVLDGLYYVDESSEGNKDSMPVIGQYVQSKKLKFYWIPCIPSDGRFRWDTRLNWKDYNVTDSYLQTGYFWHTERDELMLKDICQTTYLHGLNFEFEVSKSIFLADETKPAPKNYDNSKIDSNYMERLNTLTNVFEEKGIFSNLNTTYYMDYCLIVDMSTSSNTKMILYIDRLADIITSNII